MQKITPCLWFEKGDAEEAAKFYVSLLPDSRIDRIGNSPADWPEGKAGEVLTVDFTLAGTQYLGLNGGPGRPFTEVVSFIINCIDQAEIDRLTDAIIGHGGEMIFCGWVKDRWGLRWQITPVRLLELMKDPNPERARRAMQAMMQMDKIDIAALERAVEGE